MKGSLLIVDDDPAFSKTVRSLAELEGYRATTAATAEEGFAKIQESLPDVLVLDVRMPGMSGFDLCRKLREGERTRDIPILFLTSREEEASRILGFHVGGDDYVCKPFSPPELMARIGALLRRVNRATESVLKGGAVEVDGARREARAGKKRLSLTAMQFDLLQLFLQKKGNVLSKTYIFEAVWKKDLDQIDTHAVETLVYRLRKVLGKYGECIQAVQSLGYKWEDL
jgi:DNA-binding response OmpR family regulator